MHKNSKWETLWTSFKLFNNDEKSQIPGIWFFGHKCKGMGLQDEKLCHNL